MNFHIATSGNLSGHCSICQKRISKKVYSWSVMDEELFYWKCFLHRLFRHKKSIWSIGKFLRNLAALLIAFLFMVINLPLRLICLPFWALYEYVL